MSEQQIDIERQKSLQQSKEWRKNNPERMNELRKNYKEKHPDYKKKWRTTGYKAQIREKLGNKCMICGWDRYLHVHHKKGKKHQSDYALNRINEYLLLCPNHHDLLHHGLLNEEEEKILKKYEK